MGEGAVTKEIRGARCERELMSQGEQAALGAGKGTEMESSLRPQERPALPAS